MGTTATKVLALTIAPPPLVINTASPLADGIVGTAYSETLSATGGVAPYVWAIAAGALPPGMAFSTGGNLNGTSGTAGTYQFTVRVMDSASVVTNKLFAITIAPSGPLHHFTWNYAPTSANADAPSAVRLTARDAQERLVTDFTGNVNVSATSGVVLPSPIVITELTDGSEDQIELQNVSSAGVNTTGWYVRINDTTASINTVNNIQLALPPSLAAGGIVWISETNLAPRLWFGSALNWSTANSKGWVMLFDSTNTLRDFFVFGWNAAELSGLNLLVNGTSVTAASNWAGAPAVVGVRGAADSWQRTATSDTNTAANFTWITNGSTFNAKNAGLAIPWSTGSVVAMTPAGVTLTNGEFVGYLAVTQAANNVTLTAADGASHTGATMAFNGNAALSDTDGDGISDGWESAHGLDPAVNDAALDADADGSTNLAEFRAGTDPQDPGSRFAVKTCTIPANSQATITWDGIAGKIYRLSTSADLATWTVLEGSTVLAGATAVQSIMLDATGVPRFFVRVEIAPQNQMARVSCASAKASRLRRPRAFKRRTARARGAVAAGRCDP